MPSAEVVIPVLTHSNPFTVTFFGEPFDVSKRIEIPRLDLPLGVRDRFSTDMARCATFNGEPAVIYTRSHRRGQFLGVSRYEEILPSHIDDVSVSVLTTAGGPVLASIVYYGNNGPHGGLSEHAVIISMPELNENPAGVGARILVEFSKMLPHNDWKKIVPKSLAFVHSLGVLSNKFMVGYNPGTSSLEINPSDMKLEF